MNLDDTVTVATPEGLELDLALAGLGSRFIAGVTDLLIQTILTVILGVITHPFAGGGVGPIVFILGFFAIVFLYPVGFELLAGGRTPGKRLTHLRVMRDMGTPVDAPASAIRNLMRLIDGPLLLYLPTVFSIAVTDRNQRPGDLAAGTIVIRDQPVARRSGSPALRSAEPVTSGRSDTDGGRRWDASAVSDAEAAAVSQFLARRDSLSRDARRELAMRLAAGLRPKVTSAPSDLSPERFLEQLALNKRRR